MFRPFSLIVLFLSFMLASAHAAPVDHDVLDARLKRLADDAGIVGLAVAVIEDGEITFAEGYGVTALGGDAVTPDTVFRWASLSKGVASTAVGKMASDGQLALDRKSVV